jgi:hypothetical protein
VTQPEAEIIAQDRRRERQRDDDPEVETGSACRAGQETRYQDRRLARHGDAHILQQHPEEKDRVTVDRIPFGKDFKGVLHR